jgi:hypothetical protein
MALIRAMIQYVLFVIGDRMAYKLAVIWAQMKQVAREPDRSGGEGDSNLSEFYSHEE